MWNTNSPVSQSTWNTGLSPQPEVEVSVCSECGDDITDDTTGIEINGETYHRDCIPMYFWINDHYPTLDIGSMLSLYVNTELEAFKNPYVLADGNGWFEAFLTVEEVKEKLTEMYLNGEDEGVDLYVYGVHTPIRIHVVVEF